MKNNYKITIMNIKKYVKYQITSIILLMSGTFIVFYSMFFSFVRFLLKNFSYIPFVLFLIAIIFFILSLYYRHVILSSGIDSITFRHDVYNVYNNKYNVYIIISIVIPIIIILPFIITGILP